MRTYICQYNICAPGCRWCYPGLVGAPGAFDFCSISLSPPSFREVSRVLTPDPHLSNSTHQSLNPLLFNTFPFRSNDAQQIH
jgi:hypothetical protein